MIWQKCDVARSSLSKFTIFRMTPCSLWDTRHKHLSKANTQTFRQCHFHSFKSDSNGKTLSIDACTTSCRSSHDQVRANDHWHLFTQWKWIIINALQPPSFWRKIRVKINMRTINSYRRANRHYSKWLPGRTVLASTVRIDLISIPNELDMTNEYECWQDTFEYDQCGSDWTAVIDMWIFEVAPCLLTMRNHIKRNVDEKQRLERLFK
jgi:hypothetical protein